MRLTKYSVKVRDLETLIEESKSRARDTPKLCISEVDSNSGVIYSNTWQSEADR